MNEPEGQRIRRVYRVEVEAGASKLHLNSPLEAEMLEKVASCESVEADWPAMMGCIEPAGPQASSFLDFHPAMLAFPEATLESGWLEGFLEAAGEMLPVETLQGRCWLWHPTGGCYNALDRKLGWENGELKRPHFITHRLAEGFFTTPELAGAELFLMVRDEVLAPELGGWGTQRLDEETEECAWQPACFLHEYHRRRWSGLKFELIWTSEDQP